MAAASKVVSTVFIKCIFESLIMADYRRHNTAFLNKFCFCCHLSSFALSHKWVVIQVYFLFIFFMTRVLPYLFSLNFLNVFFLLFLVGPLIAAMYRYIDFNIAVIERSKIVELPEFADQK